MLEICLSCYNWWWGIEEILLNVFLAVQYLLGTWFLGVAVILIDDYRISDVEHPYVSESNPFSIPFSSLSMVAEDCRDPILQATQISKRRTNTAGSVPRQTSSEEVMYYLPSLDPHTVGCAHQRGLLHQHVRDMGPRFVRS
jgi:hypothetical protein